MTPDNQLATREQQLSTQEPSVALMLSGMLTGIQQGDITPQSVEVLKGMMDLYERNEKRQAEKDFAAALTALQGETIRVKATKSVDQKPDGTCRYKFAPYEEIMETVQPMLTRHGFSITFDTEVGDIRLTSICTLTHSSGHSRSNRFAVRYGKPPGSSDAQGDMSTKSYAKRGALCDALNISVDHDTDGADAPSSIISPSVAVALEARMKAAGVDRAKFLRFAGAASFEEISTVRLPELEAQLARKEAEKKPAPVATGNEPDVDWNKP